MVRVAAWLWSLGRSGAQDVLLALKTSRAVQDDVGAWCALPRPHLMTRASDGALRKVARSVGRRRVDGLVLLWAGEGHADLGRRLTEVLEQGFVESASELALNGDEVRGLSGFTGPKLGGLLSTLLSRVDDEPLLNQPEALRRLVKELVGTLRAAP
jgi:hypothetical protein